MTDYERDVTLLVLNRCKAAGARTAAQVRMALHLHKHGEAGPGEVCRAAGVSPATISSLLKIQVDLDDPWLLEEPHKTDRRRRVLRLSAKARAVMSGEVVR